MAHKKGHKVHKSSKHPYGMHASHAGMHPHHGQAHPHNEVDGKDPLASSMHHEMNAEHGLGDGHAAGPEYEEGPESENESCY